MRRVLEELRFLARESRLLRQKFDLRQLIAERAIDLWLSDKYCRGEPDKRGYRRLESNQPHHG